MNYQLHPGGFYGGLQPGGFYGGMMGNIKGMEDIAGNPFGPQFTLPLGGIRGMSQQDFEDLKNWDSKSAEELNKIRKGIKPGGPQLPLVQNQNPYGSAPQLGNAGFFYGPQAGQGSQELPIGFGGISIS
jgi:hypothetical protein